MDLGNEYTERTSNEQFKYSAIVTIGDQNVDLVILLASICPVSIAEGKRRMKSCDEMQKVVFVTYRTEKDRRYYDSNGERHFGMALKNTMGDVSSSGMCLRIAAIFSRSKTGT